VQREDILDGDRHARQNAGVFPFGEFTVHLVRLAAGKVFGKADEGMHLLLFSRIIRLIVKTSGAAVHRMDLLQGGFEDFAGTDLTGTNTGGNFGSG